MRLHPKTAKGPYDLAPGGMRTLRKGRKVGTVIVGRRWTGTEGGSFMACFVLKSGKSPVGNQFCAVGKNPRAALAKALGEAALGIKGRRGAFAGRRRRR